MNKANHRFLPLVICAVAIVTWWALLLYKYYHLSYYDWDLAFFTQACWQLVHGSQYTSVAGINYFGDHSYFITFLTLPFFYLAPHPLTLIFLKLSAFIFAAYLFYEIAANSLGQRTALVLMVLYIIFPANIFSMIYEFNPECFAPPILFWMFASFQKKEWGAFLISSILLMMIKENMALIVCAYGLYGLLTKGCSPKMAWSLFLGGAIVFYVLVIDLIPHFRHLSYHPFLVRYAYLNLGTKPGEMLMNFLSHPLMIIKVLLLSYNSRYLLVLFGAFLVPALFGWRILLLASPILLQHLLSSDPQEHSIFYHYGTTIAPFIFLATVSMLEFCRQKFSRIFFKLVISLLVIFSLLILTTSYKAFVYRLDYHQDDLSATRWKMVQKVPPEAGVIATFCFLAPLSLRKDLYCFHKVYDPYYQDPVRIKLSELNVGRAFVLPGSVHYALIDLNDLWLQTDLMRWPPETGMKIRAFLQNSPWRILDRYGSIVLLKR